MFKNEDIKISIITVVFNCKTLIENTLNSVINQSYENIEYIVIDGKSTDGTLDIIRKYENKIDVLISESDKGIYDAMNKGVHFAKGDYCIFMNSGDVFASNETLAKAFSIDAVNEDIVYGDTIADFGSYSSYIKGKTPDHNNMMTFCHQSVFVKTNLLKENPFNLHYRICADQDLFARLFLKKSLYKYCNFPIGKIEAFGYSNSNRIKTIQEIRSIHKSYNLDLRKNTYELIRAYIITFIEKIFGKKIIFNLRKLLMNS